jgi:LuxR family maltose regulon positive regulatory protein
MAEYVAILLAAFDERAVAQPVLPEWRIQAPPQLVEPLTPREQEVLRLLAEGASNSAIAEALVISVGTAKKHVNNILGKLELQSRTQAAIWAREHGMLAEQRER